MIPSGSCGAARIGGAKEQRVREVESTWRSMLLAPRQRKPGGKKGGFTPWKLNSSSICECSGVLEAVEGWFLWISCQKSIGVRENLMSKARNNNRAWIIRNISNF
jgi:hypothetical protein